MKKRFLTLICTTAALFTAMMMPAAVWGDPSAEESISPISIAIGSEYLWEWDSDLERSIAEFRYPSVYVAAKDSDRYSELSAVFETLNQKWAESSKEGFYANVDEIRASFEEGYYDRPTSFERMQAALIRSDETAVSLCVTTNGYYGGAHGGLTYEGVNLDPKTGEEIPLRDVVTDYEGMANALKRKMQRENPDLNWSEDKTALHADQLEERSWTVGPNGITFYFSSYEIGSYAEGTPVVTIPFEGYESLFNAKYFDHRADYAIMIPDDTGIYFDVDHDGEEEYIFCCLESGDYEDSGYERAAVKVDDQQIESDVWCYNGNFRLIVSGGKTMLYLSYQSDNDYRLIQVFDLTSGEPVFIEDVSAGLAQELFGDEEELWERSLAEVEITDPGDFRLTERVGYLGTADASADYHLDENGLPVMSGDGGWYTIDYPRTMTTKMDLTADTVDEKGNVTGSETLPAGTELLYYRTDNINYCDLQKTDGSLVRVYVNQEDWPYTIDGLDIEELFDGIIFAG